MSTPGAGGEKEEGGEVQEGREKTFGAIWCLPPLLLLQNDKREAQPASCLFVNQRTSDSSQPSAHHSPANPRGTEWGQGEKAGTGEKAATQRLCLDPCCR